MTKVRKHLLNKKPERARNGVGRESGGQQRVQKLLAQAGYGSRRQIEQWIREGRITVNGQPVKLGDRVDGTMRIEIDGQRAPVQRALAPRRRVIIYNKPEGEICSANDPEGRPTVFDKLPAIKSGRWVAVGRLDFNTQGLLLFTTDGELAHRLMHPSNELEREYAVRVRGEVMPNVLKCLREGVELDDGAARFGSVRDAGGKGSNHWYHVTLQEGRNREVRRLWESQGVAVTRLVRVRYGPIHLPRYLKRGTWQALTEKQINMLCEAAGMSAVADA